MRCAGRLGVPSADQGPLGHLQPAAALGLRAGVVHLRFVPLRDGQHEVPRLANGMRGGVHLDRIRSRLGEAAGDARRASRAAVLVSHELGEAGPFDHEERLELVGGEVDRHLLPGRRGEAPPLDVGGVGEQLVPRGELSGHALADRDGVVVGPAALDRRPSRSSASPPPSGPCAAAAEAAVALGLDGQRAVRDAQRVATGRALGTHGAHDDAQGMVVGGRVDEP